jgi:predicted aspartyl protease
MHNMVLKICPNKLVQFRVIKNAIIVEATLNQQKSVPLLLDTGASNTIIAPDLSEYAQVNQKEETIKQKVLLVGGETIEMPFAKLPEIRVGEAVVKNLTVGIYKAFPERPFVKGILGADFLNNFTVTIDHSTHQLKLSPP